MLNYICCIGTKDYTLASRVCRSLHHLWSHALAHPPHGLPLYVPHDFATLKQAVERLRTHPTQHTTIVLGRGNHEVDKDTYGLHYLEIPSSMSSSLRLLGHPAALPSSVVVLGGLQIRRNLHRTVHVQNLTLRQSNGGSGVVGQSAFTMEAVVVEQCGYGVYATGTAGQGRCTNVDVRHCEKSGVNAVNGGSITLVGAKTTVHHNCTKGEQQTYGLYVYGTKSSTIHLVAPLTKEQVSTDNGGGGNWGAGNGGAVKHIKTIAATGTFK